MSICETNTIVDRNNHLSSGRVVGGNGGVHIVGTVRYEYDLVRCVRQSEVVGVERQCSCVDYSLGSCSVSGRVPISCRTSGTSGTHRTSGTCYTESTVCECVTYVEINVRCRRRRIRIRLLPENTRTILEYPVSRIIRKYTVCTTIEYLCTKSLTVRVGYYVDYPIT